MKIFRLKSPAVLSVCTSLVLLLASCSKPSTTVSQTYIHKYGMEISQKEWMERGQSGQVVTTLPDHTVMTQSFSQGRLDGPTTYSYPNSSILQKIEVYDKGTLTSCTFQDLSGHPVKQIAYKSPSQTVVTTWYAAGTPRSVETFKGASLISAEYFDLNNALESAVAMGSGTKTKRSISGELQAKEVYENGHLASVTTYYPQGSPESITCYRNGQIDGIRKTFFENGSPKTIEQWVAGEQHGMTTIYSCGEKVAEVPYVHGKKNGTERRFVSGRLSEEIAWSNDVSKSRSMRDGVLNSSNSVR